MKNKRQGTFRRNEKLELLLNEVNFILGSAEEKIVKHYITPKYPTILIIGAPRSGTTLLLQWLAKTGKVSYPTNLISRFYGAPCIGAKIQQLLTSPEYNFRDEILDFSSEFSFESDLGKTKGALAPNEFWYFWRRFIPNIEPEFLNKEALKAVKTKSLLAELAAIESVIDKPFAMKGLILQFNIGFLNRIFDKVLFLFIKRNPFYNVQSLLKARESFYGSIEKWYSVKPREYDLLKDLPPFEQVAGQVYYTNCSIANELENIDPSRWIQIAYEDFCTNPEMLFSQIAGKLAKQGYEIGNYRGPAKFEVSNKIYFSEHDCNNIRAAYRKIAKLTIVK